MTEGRKSDEALRSASGSRSRRGCVGSACHQPHSSSATAMGNFCTSLSGHKPIQHKLSFDDGQEIGRLWISGKKSYMPEWTFKDASGRRLKGAAEELAPVLCTKLAAEYGSKQSIVVTSNIWAEKAQKWCVVGEVSNCRFSTKPGTLGDVLTNQLLRNVT